MLYYLFGLSGEPILAQCQGRDRYRTADSGGRDETSESATDVIASEVESVFRSESSEESCVIQVMGLLVNSFVAEDKRTENGSERGPGNLEVIGMQSIVGCFLRKKADHACCMHHSDSVKKAGEKRECFRPSLD